MLHNLSKDLVPLVALLGGGYLAAVAPEVRDVLFPIIAAIVAWATRNGGTNGNGGGSSS